MSRIKRLFEDVVADYEEDKYSIVEIAQRNGVSIGFVLHAIELDREEREQEESR